MSTRDGDTPALPANEPGRVDAVIFDVVLLAFVTIIVGTSLGLRPGPRLVPLVIGIPSLAVLAVQLTVDVLRLRRSTRWVAAEADEHPGQEQSRIGEVVSAAARVEAEDAALPAGKEARRRQLLFALWAVTVGVLAALTSFYIAAPIGLFAILIAVGRSIGRALLITLGVLGALYVTFDILLKVPF